MLHKDGKLIGSRAYISDLEARLKDAEADNKWLQQVTATLGKELQDAEARLKLAGSHLAQQTVYIGTLEEKIEELQQALSELRKSDAGPTESDMALEYTCKLLGITKEHALAQVRQVTT